MTREAFLRDAFQTLEVNETFTEAALFLRDGSRLCFCHRVGERWARALGDGLAGQVLVGIARFRLNAKHLDVQFADGSRWEARFRDPRQPI